MAMKDTINTSKVERHGKMRMGILMVEAMMMGTLKVTIMEINQVLRRKRGTQGSTHSKPGSIHSKQGSIHSKQGSTHSKDGLRQLLLP